MLKPFDQTGHDSAIVPDDVEQNRAAISDDHDLPDFGRLFEIGNCVEPSGAQLAREIKAALNRGKTVVGNNEDVGCRARISLRERLENGGEIAVRTSDGGDGRFGTW